MRRRVRVHPDAEDELAAATERYEDKSPGLGGDFLILVENELERLARSTSHSVTVPGIADLSFRRVLLDRFPFAIVFQESDDTLAVFAVAHQRRRPGYWRNRAFN